MDSEQVIVVTLCAYWSVPILDKSTGGFFLQKYYFVTSLHFIKKKYQVVSFYFENFHSNTKSVVHYESTFKKTYRNLAKSEKMVNC